MNALSGFCHKKLVEEILAKYCRKAAIKYLLYRRRLLYNRVRVVGRRKEFKAFTQKVRQAAK